jgi:hypothetical protein
MSNPVNHPFDRRAFLGAGALTLGGLLLPPLRLDAEDSESLISVDVFSEDDSFLLQKPTAFFTEAGNYKRDTRYVLGMLTSEQEQVDESALQNLRNTLNYRTKLTYNNTDKFKLAFCEAAINYFVQTPGLKFTAKIYTWGGGPSELSFGKLSLEKIDLYDGMESALSDKPLKSLIKSHSPYGPSIFFKNKCKAKVSHDVVPVNARLSNLLQFSGLLTSCVLREVKGIAAESAVKKAVVNKLKEKLGIATITAGTNVLNGKFQVLAG